MSKYCVMCGDLIDENQALCGPCTVIFESMPPDQAKKLQKVIKNEMAMVELRAALQELKRQLKIAIYPALEIVFNYISRVYEAIGDSDEH